VVALTPNRFMSIADEGRRNPVAELVELRLPPKDGRWQVRTFGIELLCAKVNDASTVRAEAVEFTLP
jgi:hypothetical protein